MDARRGLIVAAARRYRALRRAQRAQVAGLLGELSRREGRDVSQDTLCEDVSHLPDDGGWS